MKKLDDEQVSYKLWRPAAEELKQSTSIPLKWADYSWEQPGWGQNSYQGFSQFQPFSNFGNNWNRFQGMPTPRPLYSRWDNLQSGWLNEQGQYKQVNNWEPYNNQTRKTGDWKYIYQGNRAGLGNNSNFQNSRPVSNPKEDVYFKSTFKPDYTWLKNLTDSNLQKQKFLKEMEKFPPLLVATPLI